MDQAVRQIIEEKLQLPVIEGPDKRCSLQAAIRRHISEKMVLSISNAVGALVYELIRAFWDKKPQFTVIMPGLSLHLVALVKNGLIRKAITSFAGNNYPSPRPCPIIQNAYRAGQVDIECWTMRTIPQRLMAGALDWDFIPTRSLLGSTMEAENQADFKVIDAPFSKQGRIGLLSALRPDVTLIHAAAADRSGNAILTYPLSGDAFGAWASTKGVIVSAEKIVSTEYIRRHAHMVRIPAYSVLAVCEAPFGAHPSGLPRHGLPDAEEYFPDYDFMIDLNDATMDEKAFEAWMREWILDCPDHDTYLAKLGRERLLYLKGKAGPEAWKSEIMTEAAAIDFSKPANAVEQLVAAAGEVIAEKCATQNYRTILAGIGLSNLAAWLAAYALREKDAPIDLMAEIGMFGYLPRASDPSVFSQHNMHSCKMLSNIETTLGFMVGGTTNQCLGVLGAGQIDRFGNANSTRLGPREYLVGSGGANDIATTSRETVVVMNAGKHRLVEKLPYITYPGTKVRTLVTDVGIFIKENPQGFILQAYIPASQDETQTAAVARIAAKVGWPLAVADRLERLAPPEAETLRLLRLFDPRGYYIGR